MIKIFIDEKSLEVKEGITIFDAAEHAGISIPHLCYHHAFDPEGSCRMCLVEIEGLPNLELACSTNVREGMKISTQSEKVQEARKGVLEFLMAEHPLDCPICDKAGDCKLQDYYEEYGFFDSRFYENKERKRKLVHIGKRLILDQERCILCSRCVRFLKEITKSDELGIFHRGIHSEVDVYEGAPVDNNYSGNLGELCPVGAITDRDFRFKTRSWFLEKGESICPLCSRGCSIYIEHHPGFSRFPFPQRVYRIRARQNPDINDSWICDLGRYGYSFIDQMRLDKIHANGHAKAETWEGAISHIARKIMRLYHMKRASNIALILNSWLTNEEFFLVDRIFRKDLGVTKIFFADPPDEESDGFLMTNERSPNRRGALEVGFGLSAFSGDILSDRIDLLLIFGPYILDSPSLSEMTPALKEVETTVVLTHRSEDKLNSQADIVLPLSQISEKAGSLTNVDGNVQKFSPVLASPGMCSPEWWFLVELGKKIKIDFNYYNRFSHPDAIFDEMSDEISFFRERK